MKAQMKKLLDLTKETETLMEELDSYITEYGSRYIEIQQSRYGSYTRPGPMNSKNFWWSLIDANTSKPQIEMRWEESWAYGGYDEGTWTMPLSLIGDDDAFDKLEKEMETQNKKTKALEKARKVKTEKAQLKALQDKYGDKGG